MNAVTNEDGWSIKLEKAYIHLFECFGEAADRVPVRGIEAGRGWEKNIQEMLEQLDWHLQHNSRKDEDNFIRIFQIKEKFGELRVYITASEKLYDQANCIVARAEGKCEVTCEMCGKLQHGCIRSKGSWIYCLCDECFNTF